MKSMFTRILLVLVCCFAAGCGRERPPAPASPPKSGTPEPLVIADFDSCEGTNNLGEASGAAYNPPDILERATSRRRIGGVSPGSNGRYPAGAPTG